MAQHWSFFELSLPGNNHENEDWCNELESVDVVFRSTYMERMMGNT